MSIFLSLSRKKAEWRCLMLLGVSLPLAGCGVLFGKVKPNEEKSSHYSIEWPSRYSEDWESLAPKEVVQTKNGTATSGSTQNEPISEEDEKLTHSDLSFQSKKTASILSLNSSCRDRNQSDPKSLEEWTKTLLLGITNIEDKTTQKIQLPHLKDDSNTTSEAIQTTLTGRIQGEPIRVSTVVTQHDQCIYDLMYISRPRHFTTELPVFERFFNSLRWR